MDKVKREEILNLYEYEKVRQDKVKEFIEMKKKRRVFVGDLVQLFFENKFSVWFQIQEMIRAERMVKEEDINFEIETYNDLIPDKNELSITMFIEIPSKEERERKLRELVGIHDSLYLITDNFKIKALAEERSNLDYDMGKAAAVHFLKLSFNDKSLKDFINTKEPYFSIEHEKYTHKALIPEDVKEELLKDLA